MNSELEIVAGELHAELLVGSHSWASGQRAERHQPRRPRRCGGHRRNRKAELRGTWAAALVGGGAWPDNKQKRRSKLAARTAQPDPTAGPGTQKTRGSTSNNQRHTATRSVLYPRLEALPGPSGLAAASNRAAHAAPFHCLARHWHHMWHKTRPVRAQHPSVSHISRAVAARASSVQRSK